MTESHRSVRNRWRTLVFIHFQTFHLLYTAKTKYKNTLTTFLLQFLQNKINSQKFNSIKKIIELQSFETGTSCSGPVDKVQSSNLRDKSVYNGIWVSRRCKIHCSWVSKLWPRIQTRPIDQLLALEGFVEVLSTAIFFTHFLKTFSLFLDTFMRKLLDLRSYVLTENSLYCVLVFVSCG